MSIRLRLKDSTWFIISACKGNGDDASRTKQMAHMLAGCDNMPAEGIWHGAKEDSFIVFDQNKDQALKLARMFDQTHILTNEGLIEVASGDTQPIEAIIETDAADAFTRVGSEQFTALLK